MLFEDHSRDMNSFADYLIVLGFFKDSGVTRELDWVLDTLGVTTKAVTSNKYEKRGLLPGVVSLSANLITASGLISAQIKGAGWPKPRQCIVRIFNAIGAFSAMQLFVASDETERFADVSQEYKLSVV